LDWCLIATGWTDPTNWLYGLYVAIGVGLIIFVHELGHFLVATACGVKCEKFMIGFDIGGIRLLSIRRGETLYGIGILPLGGYVKMLGQEDNPAQLRREMERARQEAAANESAGAGATEADAGQESVETRLFNPRSYLAKSVPQRMAIISAGVIMNMIFAFVFAVCAYRIGVTEMPSTVGSVVAGGGAWQGGVRADDTILSIGGNKIHSYQQMMEQVINSDIGRDLPVVVRRPGIKEPLDLVVKPQKLGGKPTVGVGRDWDLQISKEKDAPIFWPGSAAEAAAPQFQHGDRIVKVDGMTVEAYGQLRDLLVAHSDKPLEVTVARWNDPDIKDDKGVAAEGGREAVKITVPPRPMKQFGLTMEMGPIAAIEIDSPAAKAGIQPGDVLKKVDNNPVGDPMKLPAQFHNLAGHEITLGLQRESKPLELKVKLSPPRNCQPDLADSAVALTELGAAYYVLDTVASVEPSSPAAKLGIQPGDRLLKARFVPPSADELAELHKKYPEGPLLVDDYTLPFGPDERNWPYFLHLLQDYAPGTTVEFTWRRNEQETTGKAAPVVASDWYNPDRGWYLEQKTMVAKAKDFGEAVRMGGQETIDAALAVYRILQGLSTNRVSARMISGPIDIAKAAFAIAHSGLGNFLVFLTLISANLAVINFLPIPVLDGGHMVLLAYEGIRGKPADERVQEALTWVGLVLILSLMVWAFGLDLGFFSRPGAH
jgi:regulator of sigma E protease